MKPFYCLVIGLEILLCFIGAEVIATQDMNQQKYPQGTYNVRSQKSQLFMWREFKNQYNKNYSMGEEYKRFKIFNENLDIIERHNKLYDRGLSSYSLGINEYSDMAHDEFVKVMNGYNPSKINKPTIDHIQYMSPLAKLKIPDEVDWRKYGYVTPVKNQGQCGSCWAFSSTGSLEGQHFRKTERLISLSEQNLVDCCKGKYGNMGCEGGWMDNSFQYIKDNGGIDTEESYPYLAAEEKKCHFNKRSVGAKDKGFVDVVPHGDETKLKEAVASIGPISVAIDASHMSFQSYKEGVYDEVRCHNNVTMLDHAVLIVGYGTLDSKDYWLVKNSWGTSWGNEGYIYMSRNKDNQCGIATRASYPLV